MTTRTLLAALMLACLALPLAACGKRGNPVPPGPADQLTYPKIYPTH